MIDNFESNITIKCKKNEYLMNHQYFQVDNDFVFECFDSSPSTQSVLNIQRLDENLALLIHLSEIFLLYFVNIFLNGEKSKKFFRTVAVIKSKDTICNKNKFVQ
jgi:hypothetical protein